MKTLIIAEAGVNHNGDLQLAFELIEAAAEAGADLVKFQTFSADRLLTRRASKANYQIESTEPKESQYDMLKKLELTEHMHEQLIAHCKSCEIGFFSTAFDIPSLDLLVKLGLKRFKVSSGEITNLPYLRHIGASGGSILLSTGMATMAEIGAALEILQNAGTALCDITVLHCNSEYPTPMADVNLRAMLTIGEAFNVAIGYSDHTLGIEVPIAAVAMGAAVIEKHFTINRDLPGPDHKASLEVAELKSMIVAIRNTEQAMGSIIKSPSTSELKNKDICRKSIVAACSIDAGEIFTELNLSTKRPGSGLSPMLWDQVIGRKAKRDYAADELVEL